MKFKDKTVRIFLIVWIGQLISAIGSGLTSFSLGVFVFQQTHSATTFALIILFSFLPSFIMLPFGGVLADRFDRRRMMIIGDAGAITGLLFILYVLHTESLALWHIYLGVALSSVFAAIQSPAYKASVSDFVTEEFYAQASGLIQLAGSAQYLISPIIAGILMSSFNIKIVLIIDVLTFLIAVTAVLFVKQQENPRRQHNQTATKRQYFADLFDSLHYLRSQKGVFCLVLLTSLLCFYIGLLQSLLGPMLLSLTDSKTLGIALSISATGMLISSLIIGIFGLKKNMVFIVSLSLALAGLFFALIGMFTQIVLITICCFLFFCTLPFANTSLEVLIRKNIDNSLQGRVWSMVGAISQVGYIIAFGSAGFLADHLFNPLLYKDGALVQTVGQFIGTGPGRGIGLLFILSGIFVTILAVVIGQVKQISALEAKA